jgi:hypothetical protein
MRPPTASTIAQAAEVLIKGAHDGTILDRAGKAYKPSTARGYEQLLNSYVVPALGGWKLSELQRRDVQEFVDDLRKQDLSPSSIANILDPLRVIFRRAIRRDEVAIDRPSISISPRSAAAATGSSRPRSRMSSSPRCPTARRRSGRSPCSAA